MLAHLGINRHALFETVANALVGAFASGKQPKGLPEPSDEEAVEKRGANSRREPVCADVTRHEHVSRRQWRGSMVDRRGDGRRKCVGTATR